MHLCNLFFSKSTFLQTLFSFFFYSAFLSGAKKYLRLSYFSKKINSAIANDFVATYALSKL